jgi:hypothetical protein
MFHLFLNLSLNLELQFAKRWKWNTKEVLWAKQIALQNSICESLYKVITTFPFLCLFSTYL